MKEEAPSPWKAYLKGVKKLPRKKLVRGNAPPRAPSAPRITPIPKLIMERSPTPKPQPMAEIENSFSFASQLDRSRERELKSGTLAINATLDLHGMKQTEAHEALSKFLAAEIARRHRHLLVITGKGAKGEGLLRQKLPEWLKAMPEGRAILRVCHAAPRHGGQGAYYIILKNPAKLTRSSS